MPKTTPSYSLVQGAGGEETSKPESWAILQDEYLERKKFLEGKLAYNTRLVKLYYETIEALALENHWGQLAKDIIRYKYYLKVNPDKAIYTMFLFCAERTYYRMHEKALEFFCDVIPELM